MGRTIAIGDIHGCANALDTLIEAISPNAQDQIITLGDYINRGADSAGVIQRLIHLSDHCELIPILGNHDECLLGLLDGEATLDRLLAMGGDSTLASYRRLPDASHEHPFPADHIQFLRGCADFHETADHIFLHASYLPFLPMIGQPATVLRWSSLREVMPGPHQSSKRVVAGHTSQKKGTILDLGYLTCIDTYCYGGGWLTALDVYTGLVWQANREGRLRPDPPRLVPWDN